MTITHKPESLAQPSLRIGIGFGGGPHTVAQIMEGAALAERSGFHSAWMTNDIGGRTPYVVLASIATLTKEMILGVAVSNPLTRHPVELAQTVATLDEASNGRVILGIGTGMSWRSLVSERWIKPISMMREAMETIRQLWAEPETSFRGVPVSIRESDWIWPDGPPAAIRKDIPIYLGARSPQMTRLAGRRADGLLLEIGRHVSDLESQIKMFRRASAKAGENTKTLEVGALISTCVGYTEDEMNVFRRVVAFYTQRLTDGEAANRGLEAKEFHEIKRVYAKYGEGTARVLYGNEAAAYESAPHVTRAMLESFGIIGTPQDCARQLEKYVTAGVTLPILMPLGCSIESVVEVGRSFLAKG